MLKNLGFSLLAVITLLTSHVGAYWGNSGDCCFDDCCGDLEVFAHALVWVPLGCDYDYATVLSGGGTESPERLDVFSNDCALESGFRVGLGYGRGCTFASVSYLWYESTDTASAQGDIVVVPAGLFFPIPTTVTSHLKYRYQNVDARVGSYVGRCCCCDLFWFANGRWTDLEASRREEATAADKGIVVATLETKEKAEFKGGAVGVGAGFECDGWCSLGLFGEINALGAIGERRTGRTSRDFDSEDEQSSIDLTYQSHTCLIPELNFRVGLSGEWTCGCVTLVGELGYELDYFWNAFSYARSLSFALVEVADDSVVLPSTRQCQDVGFSGLFFGGRVLF